MKREENDQVYMFLAGVSRNLDEVKGRILGRKPLPSIREIFSKVRQEECRKRIMFSNPRIMFSNPELTLKTEPKGSALASRGLDLEGDRRKKTLV